MSGFVNYREIRQQCNAMPQVQILELYLVEFCLTCRQNFLRLIAVAACGKKPLLDYTNILRQMTKLLSLARKNTAMPDAQPSAVNTIDRPQANGDGASVEEASQTGRKQRKRTKKTTVLEPGEDGEETGVVDAELLTLSQLQSFFRIKNGFTILKRQMQVLFLSVFFGLYKISAMLG